MDASRWAAAAMMGDQAALEMLIAHYYQDIYAFCCRRMGNSALGADVCQEAFIKMVRNLPAYRERGQFKSWLFAIALNCCRDAWRKEKLMLPLEDAGEGGSASFEEASDNALLLEKVLRKLPDVQKEAIILKYYHDFSLQDIAKVQKVPTATVKTRIHRALKKLQKILGEENLLEA